MEVQVLEELDVTALSGVQPDELLLHGANYGGFAVSIRGIARLLRGNGPPFSCHPVWNKKYLLPAAIRSSFRVKFKGEGFGPT